MKIRKATIEDLKTIQKLNEDLFKDNLKYDSTLIIDWPKKNIDYYKNMIIGKNSIAFVAEEDDTVAGYLIGSISIVEDYRTVKKIAEMDNMIVIKEFQGKGIGSNLISEFKNWAKTKKVEIVKLSVYSSNLKAIGTYKKNGFSEYCITMEAKI